MAIKCRVLTVADWRDDDVSRPWCRLAYFPARLLYALSQKTRNLVCGAQFVYFLSS